MGDAVGSASAQASALGVATAFSRLTTFALNAALVRFSSSEVLGFASNDMELLLSSLMFPAREAVRQVALRAAPGVMEGAPPPSVGGGSVPPPSPAAALARARFVNLAWLPVVPGLLGAAGAAAWFLSGRGGGGGGGPQLPGEAAAASLFCLAAGLELLSEPLFVVAQARMQFGARARVEMAASVARGAVTFALVLMASRASTSSSSSSSTSSSSTTILGGEAAGAAESGRAMVRGSVLAFALGQVAYAACVWVGYAWTAISGGAEQKGASARLLLPTLLSVDSEPVPSSSTSSLTSSSSSSFTSRVFSSPIRLWLEAQLGARPVSLLPGFAGQTVVKHVLTELDRLLLTSLVSRTERGDFAVAANYGSLPPRLLFAPVEEALRGFAARAVATDAEAEADAEAALTADVSAPRRRVRRRRREATVRAARLFLVIARGVLLAGSAVAVFGHFFAPTLVGVALGRLARSGVPSFLSWYSVYVAFMAVNGVTEAFASATADPGRLSAANVHLFLAAVACASAARPALAAYGTVALVWINCGNMALRTLSSCVYISGVLGGLREEIEEEGGEAEGAGGKAGEDRAKAREEARLLSIGQILPRAPTVAVLVAAAAALHAARAALPAPAQLLPLRAQAPFLAAGAACGLAVLGAVALFELSSLRDSWRELKSAKGLGPKSAGDGAGAGGPGESRDGKEDWRGSQRRSAAASSSSSPPPSSPPPSPRAKTPTSKGKRRGAEASRAAPAEEANAKVTPARRRGV